MPDDPYRTLGLERGASLDEVKRAYRRLVKANHPDAAGEAALPRFLAIQAAYDEIVGPDGTTRRVVGRGANPGATPRRPWEADAERAGATYRAYGGRPRPRPGARPGPRPRPSGSPRTGRPTSEATGRTDRPPGEPGERRRKKATLGSTSYDDVDPGAFSPDWGGASWYGTTSGTYWTINPKEYADPRKHGPEYQARARRAEQVRRRRGEISGETPDPEASSADASNAEAPITDASESPSGSAGVDPTPGGAAPGPPPPPTHTTSTWWEATTGDATSTSTTGAAASPYHAGSPASAPPQRLDDSAADLSTDAVIASIRGWLDDDHPTSVARIGRAVIGWAPIALGGGWLAGEISGCGRFAATCSPAVAPLTWVAQLGLLLLLILLPRLARIGTVATIAILGTVFPASILLFATGDPAGAEWGRPILGGLIILAWVVGLGFGIVREARRATRPVS
ncbi:MAG TPA: J domain-containing protein [Candidatus Limnocylindrales bacterium]|nr:J domain-containing protein [Candidatus Limnocylindrales bacterium]